MVNNQVIIIHKTGHNKGKRHDYDIYKKNHPAAPKQVVSVFDPGCLGVENDFPEQTSSMPNKKKRRQDSSLEEKDYNQNHSIFELPLPSSRSIDNHFMNAKSHFAITKSSLGCILFAFLIV